MNTTKRRTEIKRAWLVGYKAQQKCRDCPETHPACLDFHHREGEEKTMRVSKLVYQGTLSALQAEVAKCDVVCSNCHRKHHFETQTGPWAKRLDKRR